MNEKDFKYCFEECLDPSIFEFGMDCVEAAFDCQFTRKAYWNELKDMGSFEFMRGIEYVIKNVTYADGLIPAKIRKGAKIGGAV